MIAQTGWLGQVGREDEERKGESQRVGSFKLSSVGRD